MNASKKTVKMKLNNTPKKEDEGKINHKLLHQSKHTIMVINLNVSIYKCCLFSIEHWPFSVKIISHTCSYKSSEIKQIVKVSLKFLKRYFIIGIWYNEKQLH